MDVTTVRAAVESILARQERLALHIEHDVVQVRAATGLPVWLRLDARWDEVMLPGGAEVHARAAWRNHGLVIEHRHDGGIMVRETFTRQRGTDRLVVTIRVSGAGPTHPDMVVIYDRRPPGA